MKFFQSSVWVNRAKNVRYNFIKMVGGKYAGFKRKL